MIPTTLEKLTTLVQSERWDAADQQREFDRRLVEYAIANNINPLRALTGVVHVLGEQAVTELKKGLNL